MKPSNKSMRKIVNVEALILKDNKWLFVKRSMDEDHAGGSISLVGGKVEDNTDVDEVLEKNLQREIREEVGIEVEEEMTYVTSSHFISDDKESVVDIVFLCKYKSGLAKALDKNELTNVLWLTSEEALNHKLIMPWTKRYLSKALNSY